MPRQRSKKTTSRYILYNRVKRLGIEMPACSRCEKRSTKCIVAVDSSRCSECIRAGGSVKCDVHGPSEQEWALLESEEKKLSEAWRTTQGHLIELQSRLFRLDQQREMLRKRAAEMLRRGLRSLDEFDGIGKEVCLEVETNASERSTCILSPSVNSFHQPSEFCDQLGANMVSILPEDSSLDTFWTGMGLTGVAKELSTGAWTVSHMGHVSNVDEIDIAGHCT